MTAPQSQQTLADLLVLGGGRLPPGWDPSAHALLLPEAVAAAVLAAQPAELQHRIQPVQVVGWPPFGIGADVLTEATAGIFRPIFAALNPALAAEVLVVSWDEFMAKLPPTEPDPPAP